MMNLPMTLSQLVFQTIVLGNSMKYLAQITLPFILTFIVIALIIACLDFGNDASALEYYSYIFKRTLTNSMGFQAVLLKMIPLLCISAGLMLTFKAGLWNLGIDGQFFLGAVFCSAIASSMADLLIDTHFISLFLLYFLCIISTFLIGGIWGLLPIYFNIKYKINEAVTSLIMSFIGLNLGNILIKSFFRDTLSPHPQTIVLPIEYRLPSILDTRIHIAFIFVIVLVLLIHYMLNNTALGIQLRLLGKNKKTALHAGYRVNLLLILSFVASAGLIALAGGIEVIGINGFVQANWNPYYSMLAIPLVFLSRCNGFLIIFFAFVFSILIVGGESASRILQIPSYLTSVSIALIMLFSAFTDAILKR